MTHPLVTLAANALMESEFINRMARLYPKDRLDITIKVANGRIVRCGVYVEPSRGLDKPDQ